MPSEESDCRLSIRQNIEENSLPTVSYMVMNVLATVVACYGLLADSTAVVIGAMIIATLLGPITGVSLGLVEGNNQLLRKALLTEIAGVLIVLTVAAIVGKIHQDTPIGKEIFSRTAPNILDLVIALAGGAAGAYATVSPKLSVGLVGVAISTALVPPLAASSILLVRGGTKLAMGAFLLFFTNFVSIQVAASVVLWLHGYQKIVNPDQGFKKLLLRNGVSFGILITLIVLLGLNFQKSLEKQKFENKVRAQLIAELSDIPSTFLADLRFNPESEKMVITAVIRTPGTITPSYVAILESKLPHPADKSVELNISSVFTRVINKDGYLYNEPGQSDE